MLCQLLDVLECRQVESIRVILVGNYTYALKHRYQNLVDTGVLQLVGWVSQTRALEIVAAADYALQLNVKIFPYALSTKIFEYAAMGVPTLSLNYGGDIDELIRECSLGYSVNLDVDDIEVWVDRLLANELDESFRFSIEDFAYNALAKKYSDLVQSAAET